VRPARRALVGVLLLSAAASAPALPEVSVPPADYPAGVTPRRGEIRVTAAYALAADGSLRCRLVGRSRVRLIDEATCTILTARARFRPVGEERILFRWSPAPAKAFPSRAQRGDPLAVIPLAEISPDYPAGALIEGEEGVVAFDIDIAPGGAPLACRIVRPAASCAGQPSSPRSMPAAGRCEGRIGAGSTGISRGEPLRV
jgi:hypothetical protein